VWPSPPTWILRGSHGRRTHPDPRGINELTWTFVRGGGEDATFVMTLNRMIPEVDRPPLVNQYARFTLPDEPIPRWGTSP